MNELLVLALHNSAVALLLAAVVLVVTRLWRNPPLAHLLWLLVLVKLVAPPLMRLDWGALDLPAWALAAQPIGETPPVAAARGVGGTQPVDETPPKLTAAELVRPPIERPPAQPLSAGEMESPSGWWPAIAAGLAQVWSRGPAALVWLWLGGAAACTAVAVARIFRFERLLRGALPASESLQRRAGEIATRLGVPVAPRVCFAEGVEIPLVWCPAARPTIVLPMRLLGEPDAGRVQLILAHELAHLRRQDHRVRWIELAVATLYWWNPLVWFVRRQLHQAEDLCCDAWVRLTFPASTRRYAEILLETAEWLATPRIGAGLLPASPFLRSGALKARIEMILENRFAPCVGRRSLLLIGLVALVVLPSFVAVALRPARAAGPDEAPPATAAPAEKPGATEIEKPAAAEAETPAASDPLVSSEFPYRVAFEQGATAFYEGDKITIQEVRGTAADFAPGNLYLIKGTYTLASRDQGKLAASTTAAESKDGKGSWLEVQTAVVERGSGTFTLYFPMWCRGWPHVSFYPTGGGGTTTNTGKPLSPKMQANIDDLWKRLDGMRAHQYGTPELKSAADELERQLAKLGGRRSGSGSDFGGSYIGTGDSVLKLWWGTSEKDRKLTDSPAG